MKRGRSSKARYQPRSRPRAPEYEAAVQCYRAMPPEQRLAIARAAGRSMARIVAHLVRAGRRA